MDKLTRDYFNYCVNEIVDYMKQPTRSKRPFKLGDDLEKMMREEGIHYLRRRGYIFEIDLDEEDGSSLEISHHSYVGW